MLRIENPDFPEALYGSVSIDELGLPRYWHTVWASMTLSACAHSTQQRLARNVDAFYRYCDTAKHPGFLDQALYRLDLRGIETVLDGFFLTIVGKATRSAENERRWRTVVGFVRQIVSWQAPAQTSSKAAATFRRLKTLEARYAQLRAHRKRKPEPLRALPASVVQSMYALLAPDAQNNPFRTTRLRWSAFVLFLLYLHLGLRRGEALLMAVDSLKEQVDRRNGETRCWLSVRENSYESLDTRHTRPGIKTPNSVRQIPVGKAVAAAIRSYTENYRGRVDHPYLVGSQHAKPLSAESVTRIFQRISDALPHAVIQELEDRTGKSTVTPHDLRHTCAVLRLSQMLNAGEPVDMALQKMRVFFGWTPGSNMPMKYARAVFEDSLQEKWNDHFDDRVEILRSLNCGRA